MPSLYDLMYERYYYKGQFVCKFFVTSMDFSTADSFIFQQIVLYMSALHSIDDHQKRTHISEFTIPDIVLRNMDHSGIPNQRISIHSPGYIVLFARNIIPIVTGAIMSLSSAAGSEVNPSEIQLEIKNSVEASDQSDVCVANVEKEVYDDLIAMGYLRWQELCRLEERARSRTQVDSGMLAKSVDKMSIE